MPAPLSKDIREKIIRAKEKGASHRKIAKEMQVSVCSIKKKITKTYTSHIEYKAKKEPR